jgi:hypothetical protein
MLPGAAHFEQAREALNDAVSIDARVGGEHDSSERERANRVARRNLAVWNLM